MVILFRCDGTTKTGLGHVSRSLALAEAMGECGFTYRFLGEFETGAANLLSDAGVAFGESIGETGGKGDLDNTIRAVGDQRAEAVVVDSYHVDDDYIASLNRNGAPVFLIDDFGRLERYECSLLLNFTVNAARLDYPRGNQVYLLGPEYLLVRKTLRSMRRRMRPRTGDVRRALVVIGGVDPLNLSSRLVRLLLEVAPPLSVHVVAGPSHRHTKELSLLIDKFQGESRILDQLPCLAEELAWADICVCGGGLTKYEAAYLGVPTAVLSQNPDQARETVHFAGKGLALDMGFWKDNNDQTLAARLSHLIVNESLRKSLHQTGLSCFPEDPTRRAAEAFAEYVGRAR